MKMVAVLQQTPPCQHTHTQSDDCCFFVLLRLPFPTSSSSLAYNHHRAACSLRVSASTAATATPQALVLSQRPTPPSLPSPRQTATSSSPLTDCLLRRHAAGVAAWTRRALQSCASLPGQTPAVRPLQGRWQRLLSRSAAPMM